MRKPRLLLLLTLPFLLQILGVTVLVGWLSFRNGQQAVNRLAEQLMVSVSDRIVDNLTAYLQKPVQINQNNQLLVQQQLLTLDRLESWEQFLWKQVQLEPSINFIKVTNTDGVQWTGEKLESGDRLINIISPETGFHFHSYATDINGQRTELLTDLEVEDTRQGPWYREPMQAKRRVWASVFTSFLEDTLLLTISEPVYSPGDDQPDGVINTAVRLNSMGTFLKELEIGTTGQAFIVEQRPDNRGMLLATSTGEIPFRVNNGERVLFPMQESADRVTQAVSQQLLDRFSDLGQIQQPHQFEADLTVEAELIQSQRVPHFIRVQPLQDSYGLRWLIVTVVPEADFMAQIHINNRRTAMLSVGALGLAALLGLATARWLEKPLSRLSQASHRFAQGNWEQRVDVGRSSTVEVEQVARAFNSMAQQLQDSFETLEQRVADRTQALQLEQQKTEDLLLNILPAPIAERLKHSSESIAEYFEEVTILFADVVGFTVMAQTLSPLELVNLLNRIFSRFDDLAEQFGLEKIKTIGDAYMVAAGLPLRRQDHAQVMAEMALAMQAAIAEFQSETHHSFQIRIGINSGVVVAGVIGSKKFIYDLWGDAVNVASRMESHGEAGRIQVTESTYEQIKAGYQLACRGTVEIKGKGRMKTYWLLGKKPLPQGLLSSCP